MICPLYTIQKSALPDLNSFIVGPLSMYRHREFEGGLGCRPPHVFLWRSGVNDAHISNFGRFGSGMVLVSQIEGFFAQYI